MFSKKTLRDFSLAALSLIAIPNAATALSSDYYTSSSKLSSGKWVKVKVSDNGIYQITYDQLRQLGFSDPSKVAVFGYGGAQLTNNTFSTSMPDDIKQTASFHTNDDRLLFYGEGCMNYSMVGAYSITFNENTYDTAGTYFLSDSEAPASIRTSPITSSNNTPLTYYYHVELQDLRVQNPGEGGAIFHGPRISAGEGHSFTFHIKNLDNTSKNNSYGIFQYYFSVCCTSKSTSMEVEYPTNASISSKYNYSASAAQSSSKLYQSNYGNVRFTKTDEFPLSDDDITFKVSLPSSSAATYAAINKAYVVYPRTTSFSGEKIMFLNIPYTNSNQGLYITDAPSNLKVWNVTNVNDIFSYSTSYNSSLNRILCSFGSQVYTSETGAARLVAFDPSAEFATPVFGEEISNQNIHGDATPDMVIITTNALYDHAEQLAAAHRKYQGLTVNVYRQQDIFNEFSSGSRCAMAYRRLAKMLYDRDPEKFKYLLLYGASSWDNRGIIKDLRDELLISYEVELEKYASDSGANFTSDNYFAFLSDDYDPSKIVKTPVNIAVGRIPAVTPDKAQNYNDKIISLLANPQAPQYVNQAIMLSDDGNSMAHLNQSEEAIKSMKEINPNLSITRAHNILFPWTNGNAECAQKIILAGLSSGAGYMSYSGHGNSEAFTGERLWNKQTIEKNSYSTPIFGMFATCDAFAFDRLDNGMAESMLFSKDGGAHSVVAACRSVYLEYNQYINLAIAKQYAAAGINTTVGDIYREAKNSIISSVSTDNALANTMCYNLAGDPAFPIYGANNNIVFTKINGNDLAEDAEDASVKVKPIDYLKVEGKIVDQEGNFNSNFNGNVLVTLYEAPRSLTTYKRDSSDKDAEVQTIEIDQAELAQAYTTVTNGVFTANFYIPTPGKECGTNRLNAYALADNNDRAAGTTYSLSVDKAPAEITDNGSEAPSVVEAYINDSTFSNGDVVNSSSFNYYALINPSSVGLNISQGSIGSSSTLVLDGTNSYPEATAAITIREDGLAELSYDISDVSDGRHTLVLTVANNNGQRSSYTTDFVVVAADATAKLSVDELPARSEATINLEHSFTDTPDCRLIIQSEDGTTVLSQQNCSFPYSWNLRDLKGNKVADGRYRAFVVLNNGVSYTSSNAQEIVVLQ
jgi:hypothetical protein